MEGVLEAALGQLFLQSLIGTIKSLPIIIRLESRHGIRLSKDQTRRSSSRKTCELTYFFDSLNHALQAFNQVINASGSVPRWSR